MGTDKGKLSIEEGTKGFNQLINIKDDQFELYQGKIVTQTGVVTDPFDEKVDFGKLF